MHHTKAADLEALGVRLYENLSRRTRRTRHNCMAAFIVLAGRQGRSEGLSCC